MGDYVVGFVSAPQDAETLLLIRPLSTLALRKGRADLFFQSLARYTQETMSMQMNKALTEIYPDTFIQRPEILRQYSGCIIICIS